MATFALLFGDYLDVELGSSDRANLFTTARRKDAVNRAHVEFAKQTGCFIRQTTITLVDGTPEYDLDSTGIISSGDYIDVSPVAPDHKYTTAAGAITYVSGEDFPRIDIPQLNREFPGWRVTTTQAQHPSSWYLREDGGAVFLGVVPTPDVTVGDTSILTLPYLAVPPAMVADGDEPFTVGTSTSKARLRPWHQALVHYAAALLEPLRKNYAGEKRQRELFAGFVADYLQKQGPKGGQQIVFAQHYYREARGRMTGGRPDPRRWP